MTFCGSRGPKKTGPYPRICQQMDSRFANRLRTHFLRILSGDGLPRLEAQRTPTPANLLIWKGIERAE